MTELCALIQKYPSDFCLICGSSPAIIGIFAPEDPQLWGAAPGKTRFVRYCLCLKCHENPETPKRAEKIIQSELAGGGLTHAD